LIFVHRRVWPPRRRRLGSLESRCENVTTDLNKEMRITAFQVPYEASAGKGFDREGWSPRFPHLCASAFFLFLSRAWAAIPLRASSCRRYDAWHRLRWSYRASLRASAYVGVTGRWRSRGITSPVPAFLMTCTLCLDRCGRELVAAPSRSAGGARAAMPADTL
jgi:hypothetical protein